MEVGRRDGSGKGMEGKGGGLGGGFKYLLEIKNKVTIYPRVEKTAKPLGHISKRESRRWDNPWTHYKEVVGWTRRGGRGRKSYE